MDKSSERTRVTVYSSGVSVDAYGISVCCVGVSGRGLECRLFVDMILG